MIDPKTGKQIRVATKKVYEEVIDEYGNKTRIKKPRIKADAHDRMKQREKDERQVYGN
jgi:hypothetical protein